MLLFPKVPGNVNVVATKLFDNHYHATALECLESYDGIICPVMQEHPDVKLIKNLILAIAAEKQSNRKKNCVLRTGFQVSLVEI